MRELVVGVAALGDLAGSIIVKILHNVEGGDVEQVCSNLATNLSYLQLLIFLSLSLVFYILHALIVYIYYMLDIPLCFIYIHAWVICSHLYLTKRAIVAPQLLIYRSLEKIVHNPSPGIQLHSLGIQSVFI